MVLFYGVVGFCINELVLLFFGLNMVELVKKWLMVDKVLCEGDDMKMCLFVNNL